jgi:hypothetical protein
MVKNKKGWIKIVEAFFSIVLLMSVMFLIIQSNNLRTSKEDTSDPAMFEILKVIEANQTFREEILTETNFLIDSGNESFAPFLKQYMQENNPPSLECYLRICSLDMNCLLERISSGEIYSREVLITSTKEIYSPRKLKIFCIKNE